MATIILENFPDPLYEQLKHLAQEQRRSLAQEVIHLLEQAVGPPVRRSILELRGLGKDRWEGIDPVVYVRAERDSWDH